MCLARVLQERQSTVPFVVTCLELIFKMVGIYLNPEYKRYEKYHIYLCVVVYVVHTTLVCLYLVTIEKSYKNILDTSLFLIGNTSLLLILCAMHLSRERFIKCYENVASVDRYIDHYFYKLVDKDLYDYCPSCVVFIAAIYGGLGLYPLSVASFTDAKLGSPITLIIPENVPWDESNPVGYTVLLTIQYVCAAVGISIHISFTCFIGIYCIIIEVLIEMLKDEIKLLDMNGVNAEKQLIKAFHRHQHLKVIVGDFSQIVETVVNVSMAPFCSFIVLLLTSLVCLEGIEIFDYLKLLNLLFLGTAFFVAECYVGEYINGLNNDIRYRFYDIDWYEQPMTFKKRIHMILLFLQMPFRVRFMNALDVNLSLFMDCTRRMYAVIQLLVRVRK